MTNQADNPQQLSPGEEKLHACTEYTAGKVLYGCQGINAHHRNVPAEVMTERLDGSIRVMVIFPQPVTFPYCPGATLPADPGHSFFPPT